ncbi:hypothetical protein [Agrococcus sp. Marseille-P2731]|uniref:hypothetical protein n=1 Tax=Agrococcus sp. Marseille-P2731 TaxID=1841862 RepID=UPI00093130B3|nr:hypothetical protein [Agrococcus sp. Marseille-P2731]
MGILDDAKGKLGDAAGWVKDRADQIGDQAHGAGHSIGERAADAKHWVESRISSGETEEKPTFERTGGGGDFAHASADASDEAAADAPIVAGVDGHGVDAPSLDGSGVEASDSDAHRTDSDAPTA